MAIKIGDPLIYTDDKKREWKVQAVGNEEAADSVGTAMVLVTGGPWVEARVPVQSVRPDDGKP